MTAARHRHYDQHQRDPEAKAFYNSAAWKAARKAKLAANPVCQRCESVFAEHVHHIKPLKQCRPEEKLDRANLMSLCAGCHNIIEAETAGQEGERPAVTGMLTLVEDDEYYLDAEAADRPIRFVEKFCRHYEGRFAGQPFKLLDWQKRIIRDLFGWKCRATGLRRFKELYLITAKGAGKTPMLAAIGLYMLLGDGEAGAHVVSMASSFEQANLTFDAAKKYIGESAELSRHKGIERKQFAITAPRHSKWTTISGKPNGRSGPRPSCVIADECHEWGPGTAQAYDLLTANLFKRAQPLLLVATNAGADKQCFAWTLHERAVRVLEGKSDDRTLYPVIYEAPRHLDHRSEEAAGAANPSIGEIVTFEQLKPELDKGEARYRRLYLSQWVTGTDKWLDMATWDARTGALDAAKLKDAPLYVGLDASEGDDLFAVDLVWVTPERFYVDARFWMPRATAEQYQQQDPAALKYLKWADDKASGLTLLDGVTIADADQLRIAADIIELAKAYKLQAVCFDRAYSDHCVAAIEAEGIRCERIGQGWGVSDGCKELARRLKEDSITIAPNPVLALCAANAEIKHDERGNYWPAKPHAKGRYAGTRKVKIDGITALVTALTEARKHHFPRASQKWTGEVVTLNVFGGEDD